MSNSPQFSELREVKEAIFQSPSLRMRLAKTDGVDAFPFPSRSPSKFLEAALPGFVEFNKELSLNIARHVGDPIGRCSKLFQFVDLIEGGQVSPIALRSPKACEALFEREVPKEALRALPSKKPYDLLLAWIDPKSKPPANQHGSDHN
jgi:hypothetical protein